MNVNKCDGLFGRIYVLNDIEHVIVKVFNTIKAIKESKKISEHVSCECRCEFDCRKCNLRQKWENNNCQCECKEPRKDKVSDHIKH